MMLVPLLMLLRLVGLKGLQLELVEPGRIKGIPGHGAPVSGASICRCGR